MSLILPFSDSSQYVTGGIYAPTAANFPACKHFWSCPQSDIGKDFGSGTGGLTDLMGRAHLLKSSGVALAAPASPDGFSVFPNQANGGTTVQGTLSVPTGTQATLLVSVVETNATAGFILGDYTLGNVVLMTAANNVGDSDTTANGTAFTLVSAKVGRATLVRTWNALGAATTGQAQFESNLTSTITDLGDAATTGVPIFTAWGATDQWACASTNTKLYGVALFIFASIPSDAFVKSLLAWITYQWANGNKWLPPQLKGVS
ncbi:MAG: hypothetical protein NUV74_05350 [Candidatus Brocadiaceae bacterium]|nr:hypothetical protein [Candidatus Brocadiaceae bacterium]